MDAAIWGFLGVAVGALITTLREYVLATRRELHSEHSEGWTAEQIDALLVRQWHWGTAMRWRRSASGCS